MKNHIIKNFIYKSIIILFLFTYIFPLFITISMAEYNANQSLFSFMGVSYGNKLEIQQREKGEYVTDYSKTKLVSPNETISSEYNFHIQETPETKVYRSMEGTVGVGGLNRDSKMVQASRKEAEGKYTKTLNSGQYNVWYRSMGRYNEKDVDIKVTLVDYELSKRLGVYDNEDEMSAVYFLDNTGNQTVGIDMVKVKFEFFEHDSSIEHDTVQYFIDNVESADVILSSQKKIQGVKGFYTVTDIDVDQGVVFPSNKLVNVYVTPGNEATESEKGIPEETQKNKWLKHATVNEGEYFYSHKREGVSNPYKSRITALFNTGSSGELDLCYTYPWSASLLDIPGGMWAESQKLISTEFLDPEKKVYNKDANEEEQTYGTENTLQNATQEYVYSIEHEIPFESSEFYYEKYEIEDTIPAGLKVLGINIEDDKGRNYNEYFTTSIKNNKCIIKAKDSVLGNANFYNKKYKFQISVKAENLSDIQKYYNSSTSKIEISNTAKVNIKQRKYYLESETSETKLLFESSLYDKDTNEAKTNVPIGKIRVIKRDAANDTGLKGAVIGIYRDSGCRDLVRTVETGDDGTVTADWLEAGEYWLKEISAPSGYEKIDQIQNIEVTAGNTTNVTFLNASYGYIKVIKKDPTQDKLLDGARFGIYMDRRCQNLADIVTTGKDEPGTVTSNKLVTGRYYIKEIEAPQNYAKTETVYEVDVVGSDEIVTKEIFNSPSGYIRVSKKDSNTKQGLQGAKINIYSDSQCSNLVQSLVTSADGTATSSAIASNSSYYVKEVEAPSNYTLNSTVQNVYVNPTQTAEVVVEDRPNTIQIEVSKLDDNTGRVVTKEETVFALYEWNASSNSWVAPTHINTGTIKGTASDGKGAILREKSGGNGTYRTTVYYNQQNQGKFRVVEYSRPWGYVTANWSTQVQILRDGQVFMFNSQIRNRQVRGQINFKKNDGEVNYKSYAENYAQGDATIQGAVYGLYAKENIQSPDNGSILYSAGQQIATGTTDENGKIAWPNLYLGKYYIQEITPSVGYLKDDTQHEVDLKAFYHNQYYARGDQTTQYIVYQNTTPDQQYNNTEQRVISKERVKKRSFQLTKLNLSEDSTMSDPLQGAGFKVYLIKDLTAVKNGEIKADENGQYNPADFKKIDFAEEQTALDFNRSTDGERIPELFSNELGIVVSPELAYGKYVVIESTVPEGVKIIDPFLVDIQEDNRTPQNMVYPIDRDFEARIKIVKKDATTGKTVLKENAAYRIWDIENEKYVEQWITYPTKVKYGTEDNPYKTSKDGYLITPENLPKGEYELRELMAPEGYVLTGREENPKNNVRFTINNNVVSETDLDLGTRNIIIVVDQVNEPQVGTITVLKQGEFLSKAEKKETNYEFEYTKRPVTDAKFAIYAKEDVYTQDNQKDKIYVKDQMIREVETNEEGKAIFEKLPIGKYYVKETKAGNGFILNTEQKEFEITYQGQEQAITYQETTYENERQKIQIDITKKDREKGNVVQGAEFGLYTKEAIHYRNNSGNNETIQEGELIGKLTSAENGIATFNNEKLPLGKYYIKELKAPRGYATNREEVDIDATYVGQDVDKIKKQMDFTNIKTNLKIKIVDNETYESLKDTQFVLKDENGNEIGRYTQNENGEIEVRGLEVGKKYIIEETKQRNGYVKDILINNENQNEDELQKEKNENGTIQFTIKDSEEPQKVTMSNVSKVGKIQINKTGDVLVGTTKDQKGNMQFNYEKQKIDTATFEIYAKEDIIHPDGKQGVIVTAGSKIGEGQTKEGTLIITKFQEEQIQTKPELIQLILNRGLPIGIYEIKETKAPEGYYFRPEEQVRTVMVESRNDNDEIETVNIEVNNPKQSTNIGRPNPSLKVEKKAEKQVYKAGEQIIYNITVTNTGNTVLKDVEVKETMQGGEFKEQEGITKKDNQTVKIDRLEMGEVIKLTYYYNIPKEMKGKLDNKVVATATAVNVLVTEEGTEEEPITSTTDDANEKVWIETWLDKTANKKMYRAGDTIQYTLNVMNPNDEAISDARVIDEKIAKDAIIKTSKEGIHVQEEGIIEIGKIEPREIIEIVYTYKIPENYDQDTLTNEAKLNGNINAKPIEVPKATTTVQIKKSAIEITKQTQKETYQRGEEIEYIIKVSNVGPIELTNVTVKETLANGKFEGKTGIEVKDNQTVNIERLKVGESVYLTYKYVVEEDRKIGEKMPNKVVVTGKGIIPNPNDPDNPKIEDIEDETNKEVIIKTGEDSTNNTLGVYKTDIETGEKIEGALFGLYSAQDMIGKDNTILMKQDELLEKVLTNKEGYAQFKSDLPIGKYYIQEMEPSKGYIHNDKKIEVDSTKITSTEEEYKAKMELQNKKTEINVAKIEKAKEEQKEETKQEEKEQEKQETKEEEKGQEIKVIGAKLQIVDDKNNVVKEWKTDEEVYNIKGLEIEKEYTLHEASPAKGYITAPDIKFRINRDGSLQIAKTDTIEGTQIPTIVMKDDTTKIKVNIVDKETGERIKDIVVQIIDKDTKKVVYEYTTDGTEKIIEKIPIGNYEIVEKEFPKDKGYVSIDTQEFSIEDVPEVQEKEIKQDYTKLDVSFIDEITKNLIPGAVLEIRNDKGEVVSTIDNTGEHYYMERLPIGEYTIVEVETPEGYEPKEPITFSIKDVPKVQYVVIENKRKPLDLEVKKYTSSITINGQKRAGTDYEHAGGLTKVDINAKKIKTQKVQIIYKIRITNTGQVVGNVGKVVDTIPAGLSFNPKQNPNYWKVEGNQVITTDVLADKEIQPGQFKELEMVLDWEQNSFNFGNKTNRVSIEGISNHLGFEEIYRDNNTSTAESLFSIGTGLEVVLWHQILVIVIATIAGIGILLLLEIKIIKFRQRNQ